MAEIAFSKVWFVHSIAGIVVISGSVLIRNNVRFILFLELIDIIGSPSAH